MRFLSSLLSYDWARRMKVTIKQAWVLENFHRIVTEDRRGITRCTLDGQDCRPQVISLGAKGIVRWEGHGRPVKIAEPEGVMRDGWEGRRPQSCRPLFPLVGEAAFDPAPGRAGRDAVS